MLLSSPTSSACTICAIDNGTYRRRAPRRVRFMLLHLFWTFECLQVMVCMRVSTGCRRSWRSDELCSSGCVCVIARLRCELLSRLPFCESTIFPESTPRDWPLLHASSPHYSRHRTHSTLNAFGDNPLPVNDVTRHRLSSPSIGAS